MKKSTILLFAIITSKIFSQSSAVSDATLYQQEGDLVEAKKSIDKATIHEKTSLEPKTWYYRGLIYSDIFASKEPGIRMLSDSANRIAVTAFNKAIALENKEKGTYTKKSKDGLETVAINSINEGISYFDKKDMAKARVSFETAVKARPTDTVAANNVLVACQYLKDTMCLMDAYKRMAARGKEKPEYYYWTYLYYQKKDTNVAYKALQDGITKFPTNKIFVQNYIEELFAAKKYAQVKERLAVFVKEDPKNKIAKLKLAVTYEALNELDNAEAQYKEVLALDPANTMALYNLGIIQYRKALITLNQKDAVKPEERNTKGKELDEKYKKTLYEAAKSFEDYRKIRPKDDQVKQVLTDVYKRLKRDDMIELLK